MGQNDVVVNSGRIARKLPACANPRTPPWADRDPCPFPAPPMWVLLHPSSVSPIARHRGNILTTQTEKHGFIMSVCLRYIGQGGSLADPSDRTRMGGCSWAFNVSIRFPNVRDRQLPHLARKRRPRGHGKEPVAPGRRPGRKGGAWSAPRPRPVLGHPGAIVGHPWAMASRR